jgi:hypothetical protein
VDLLHAFVTKYSQKKSNKIKRWAGGLVYAVEHLPRKCKALISNHSTTKINKINK